ncbi:hypothetical protein AB3466_20480 [Sphingobacterium thalpophilum]|uniref:hypothetical protein n=1 Tax=Sphingobacterium thalpophilum TaxID=259 RepID=UPI0037D9DF8F
MKIRSIFKARSLILVSSFVVVFTSCEKKEIPIEGVERLKSRENNADKRDIYTLKEFYGKSQNVDLDSIEYHEKDDNFLIIGRNLKMARTDVALAFQQSQSPAVGCYPFYVPHSAGYCSYPIKWYNDFVIKKKQPYEMIDLQYYRNSILPSQVSFPFSMSSPNGRFSLIGQVDGNLLIRNNSNGKILWDAGSFKKYGTAANYKMTFQNDGNLVIYGKPSGSTTEVPVFATSNLYVSITDDWYAGSISSRAFYLLQNDGNLVLYFDLSNRLASPLPTVIGAQPIAETRTWGGQTSNHWNQIK